MKKKKSKKVNIFDYLNYRQFLKDIFAYKKKVNPRYSYRVFARQAGFSSPATLKYVIDGERNVSDKSLLKIADFKSWISGMPFSFLPTSYGV